MRMITDDELILKHGLECSCAETPPTLDDFEILVEGTVRCVELSNSIVPMGLPSLLLAGSDNSHTSYLDL